MQFDFLNNSSLAKVGPATNKALETRLRAKALWVNINFMMEAVKNQSVG